MDLMQHILFHELALQQKVREARKRERTHWHEPTPKKIKPIASRISKWVRKFFSRKQNTNQ